MKGNCKGIVSLNLAPSKKCGKIKLNKWNCIKIKQSAKIFCTINRWIHRYVYAFTGVREQHFTVSTRQMMTRTKHCCLFCRFKHTSEQKKHEEMLQRKSIEQMIVHDSFTANSCLPREIVIFFHWTFETKFVNTELHGLDCSFISAERQTVYILYAAVNSKVDWQYRSCTCFRTVLMDSTNWIFIYCRKMDLQMVVNEGRWTAFFSINTKSVRNYMKCGIIWIL